MMSAVPVPANTQQQNQRDFPAHQWTPDDNRSPSDTIFSKNYLQTAESLTKAQLALGVIIAALQIVTTTFDDNFQQNLNGLTNTHIIYFGFQTFGDIFATGIWVGFLVISAAAIGMSGYRRQSKCLIATHLVFNTLVLPSTVVAIGFLSSVIDQLNDCRYFGIYFTIDGDPYTTQQPLLFYGQILQGSSGYFQCVNVIFSIWSALDGIILASCIVELIITVILIVFNSLALCNCCRFCCVCYRSNNMGNHQTPYRPLTADVEQHPRVQPLWQNQPPRQGDVPQPQHILPGQPNYPVSFPPQPGSQVQFPPAGPAQPPAGPIQPSIGPAQPPAGPAQPPAGPAQPPAGPAQFPVQHPQMAADA